jgi:hypothetical protein
MEDDPHHGGGPDYQQLDVEKDSNVGDSAATSPFGTACLVTAILVFSSNSAVFAEMQAAHPFFDACNTLCGASVVVL